MVVFRNLVAAVVWGAGFRQARVRAHSVANPPQLVIVPNDGLDAGGLQCVPAF